LAANSALLNRCYGYQRRQKDSQVHGGRRSRGDANAHKDTLADHGSMPNMNAPHSPIPA
jgi:hypothetical protein